MEKKSKNRAIAPIGKRSLFVILGNKIPEESLEGTVLYDVLEDWIEEDAEFRQPVYLPVNKLQRFIARAFGSESHKFAEYNKPNLDFPYQPYTVNGTPIAYSHLNVEEQVRQFLSANWKYLKEMN